MRNPVVVSEQAQKHRQAAERRVRREQEHKRHGEPDRVERRPVPERRRGELREHGDASAWHDVEADDQRAESEQHHRRAAPRASAPCVERSLTWGSRKLGTALAIASTPVSALQPAANAFRIRMMPTASLACTGIVDPIAATGWRADQPAEDHRGHAQR